MSGHSKWSKVKHQKKVTDAVKSRDFTRASRAITVAVKEGGGLADPDKNFRLRLAIDKAREVNMPKDTIERAITKAADPQSASIEQILYEGYGPGGIAILVNVATDNRQRMSSALRNLFSHAGGSLAAPGSVSFQFRRLAVVVVRKAQDKNMDDILETGLNAGASDIVEKDDVYEVYTEPENVIALRNVFRETGWEFDNWEIIMQPVTIVSPGDSVRMQNEVLLADLGNLDDVQEVFSTLS